MTCGFTAGYRPPLLRSESQRNHQSTDAHPAIRDLMLSSRQLCLSAKLKFALISNQFSSRAAVWRRVLSMPSRLFLLLAMVPLAEIWLLMLLAEKTNWLTTIAVVLSTGAMGIGLVRWQGIKTIQEIQRQLAAGQSPSKTIVSGVLILVAGAMLLTPGLLTDTAGFLLLIPAVRSAFASYLQRRFVSRMSAKFRSSVWVQSGSAGPGFHAETPCTESERPSVVVVEPNVPKLDKLHCQCGLRSMAI